MALIKFGGGVTQMSGSIAGNTYARNRYGNYARARTKPVNPNSERQQVVRGIIAYLTEQWSGALTAAQRTAWETYGAAIVMTNRLGEAVYMTGFNHYIRSNSVVKQIEGTIVADGPTQLSLPEKDPTLSVSGSAGSDEIEVTFDDSLDWLDEAGAYLAVYLGRPKSATINFFNGPWRYAGKVEGDDTTPPTSPATIAAPFTLTEGQKIWVYCRIVRADGRLSEPFRDDAIVGS